MQKFRPTRPGGFSGAKAYIRYVEVLKKRRNAVGRTFCDAIKVKCPVFWGFHMRDENKNHLYTLGRRIRERRKALRVSAVVTAETAGLSRVTLHRIEKGEPSVSMGAYYSVATALGLAIDIQVASLAQGASQEQTIPVRIKLADYPQLRLLAWHIPGAEELSPLEAFALYENNQRHIDKQTLEPHEKRLIEALGRALTDRY